MEITSDFQKLGPVAAFDTETALAPKAFEGRDCVRLLQAYSPTHEFWYDLKTFTDDDWSELKTCLENPELTLIFQNAAFDLRVLRGCGIDVLGQVEDTYLQSFVITNGLPQPKGETNNNLKQIVYRECGVVLDKSLQSSDWMNEELTEEKLEYGMNDVRYTWKAFHKMVVHIERDNLKTVYEIELKALKPTIEMESSGILIDRAVLDDYMLEHEKTRTSSL